MRNLIVFFSIIYFSLEIFSQNPPNKPCKILNYTWNNRVVDCFKEPDFDTLTFTGNSSYDLTDPNGTKIAEVYNDNVGVDNWKIRNKNNQYDTYITSIDSLEKLKKYSIFDAAYVQNNASDGISEITTTNNAITSHYLLVGYLIYFRIPSTSNDATEIKFVRVYNFSYIDCYEKYPYFLNYDSLIYNTSGILQESIDKISAFYKEPYYDPFSGKIKNYFDSQTLYSFSANGLPTQTTTFNEDSSKFKKVTNYYDDQERVVVRKEHKSLTDSVIDSVSYNQYDQIVRKVRIQQNTWTGGLITDEYINVTDASGNLIGDSLYTNGVLTHHSEVLQFTPPNKYKIKSYSYSGDNVVIRYIESEVRSNHLKEIYPVNESYHFKYFDEDYNLLQERIVKENSRGDVNYIFEESVFKTKIDSIIYLYNDDDLLIEKTTYAFGPSVNDFEFLEKKEYLYDCSDLEPNGLNEKEEFLIDLYPNPTSQSFEIESNLSISRIDMFTIDGVKVKSWEADDLKYYVGDLKSGMYILNITSEKGMLNKKIVVD